MLRRVLSLGSATLHRPIFRVDKVATLQQGVGGLDTWGTCVQTFERYGVLLRPIRTDNRTATSTSLFHAHW